jgi:dTDP-L-rhamnose 4-epimerase
VRVLTTGHAGFVGRAVVRSLEAEGHEVVGLDLTEGADVTDLATVRARTHGVDAVIHLAAKVGLEQAATDVDDYVRVNDVGVGTVLRAAAEAGVSRLVLASSMVVYGEGRYACPEHGVVAPGPRRLPDLEEGRFEPPCPHCGHSLTPELVPESAALDPRSVYAATKVHLEHLASVWAARTGATVAALRYHNVYGAGMPRDTPYAGVTSLFRSALARGEAPRVFEDGRQRRNFVHVDDVADATVAALTAHLPAGLTPVNVGSATVTTVGQMAAALAEQLGGPAPVVTGEFRVGDVRHVTADCSAAARLLGWTPRVELAEGLRRVEAT